MSALPMSPTTAPPQTVVAATAERSWLAALLGAALLLLAVGIALPVLALLGMSLWGSSGEFVGLAHFEAYARSPNVLSSLFNSVWLSALSASVCVLLAYGYAYALTQSCVRGARLFRAVALIPLLAPSLLMAISLIYLFGDQGLLKSWLLAPDGQQALAVHGYMLVTMPGAPAPPGYPQGEARQALLPRPLPAPLQAQMDAQRDTLRQIFRKSR